MECSLGAASLHAAVLRSNFCLCFCFELLPKVAVDTSMSIVPLFESATMSLQVSRTYLLSDGMLLHAAAKERIYYVCKHANTNTAKK